MKSNNEDKIFQKFLIFWKKHTWQSHPLCNSDECIQKYIQYFIWKNPQNQSDNIVTTYHLNVISY